MSESLLKVIGWGNLADKANAEMQARIDDVSRRASWDYLQNSPDMWIMRVRSTWAAFGATEESIIAEAMRLRAEAMRRDE